MYSMTKCDSFGIKAVYNYKNRILLLQRAEKMKPVRLAHPDFGHHKSFIQHAKYFFIIWYTGTRWQMHQLTLAHIRMPIIIQMYRKRKRYILLTVLSFFLILTFSALRVGLNLTKKSKLHIRFILNIFQEQNVAWVVLKSFITITITIMLWKGVNKCN